MIKLIESCVRITNRKVISQSFFCSAKSFPITQSNAQLMNFGKSMFHVVCRSETITNAYEWTRNINAVKILFANFTNFNNNSGLKLKDLKWLDIRYNYGIFTVELLISMSGIKGKYFFFNKKNSFKKLPIMKSSWIKSIIYSYIFSRILKNN